MSYKVMDAVFCVGEDVDTLARAKQIAAGYAQKEDVVGPITIEDESTGETVVTGTITIQWTDTP